MILRGHNTLLQLRLTPLARLRHRIRDRLPKRQTRAYAGVARRQKPGRPRSEFHSWSLWDPRYRRRGSHFPGHERSPQGSVRFEARTVLRRTGSAPASRLSAMPRPSFGRGIIRPAAARKPPRSAQACETSCSLLQPRNGRLESSKGRVDVNGHRLNGSLRSARDLGNC